MNGLSDLTIVIPSYKRQKYLLRQILFWKDYDVNPLILDGSPTAAQELLDCAGDHCRYIHLPISIEERFGIAAQMIETKYAAMLSDDELFLPSSLKTIVQFLDNNLSYSACKGNALGFQLDSTGKTCGQQAYQDLKDYDLNDEDPRIRMNRHMSPYVMASLWAVHRSEVLKICLNLGAEGPKYSTAAAFEAQVSLVTAWCGKVKVVNELMWLRSFENENVWWSFGNLSLARWFNHAQYASEVDQFICDLASATSERKEDFKVALAGYVSECKLVDSRLGFTRLLARRLPDKVKVLLRVAVSRFGLRKDVAKIPLIDSAQELAATGVDVDIKELVAVCQFIEHHNQSISSLEGDV